MKNEPEDYSIDDLKRDKTEPWDGIRNYQVRNMILQLIKAPGKEWRQGDDKMYGILSKKIMEEIKIKINSLI